MNIDALRLLIIGLVAFCALTVVSDAIIGYLITGGRTFSILIQAHKEIMLLALGILGGAVTGHHVGSKRKEDETDGA
jgi:hypothetical protein